MTSEEQRVLEAAKLVVEAFRPRDELTDVAGELSDAVNALPKPYEPLLSNAALQAAWVDGTEAAKWPASVRHVGASTIEALEQRLSLMTWGMSDPLPEVLKAMRDIAKEERAL